MLDLQSFTVSRDDAIYEAWPDVALTRSGRLVCVFSECTHHGDRSYTRIVCCHSDDRVRSWSSKRPVTAALDRAAGAKAHWNCARVTALPEDRLAVVVDRIAGRNEGADESGELSNHLFFSDDDGMTWTGPVATPVFGIVPDKLKQLEHGPHAGRWLLSAHSVTGSRVTPFWRQQLWYSDDQGKSWSDAIEAAHDPALRLCEGSILELPKGDLVCFLRENSFRGFDSFKTVSHNGGESWSAPVAFPIPACHRPVSGMLRSGEVLITFRLLQGGLGWTGWWTQNFMGALTDIESCLAPARHRAHTRIFPIDYDRSCASDTGYSGWVQFDDGEIYIVNYIMDDAPKAQIRGYAVNELALRIELPH